MDKDCATSPPTFMACIGWSQPSTTSFGYDIIPAAYIPKRSHGWKPNIDPFPPTTKPHPLNPLDRGSTSLVLTGYKLVMLRPLCACSISFCFCLLSFQRRFYHRRLVLFRSTACLYLIFSCVSCCICHFL